jgi:hypothetical protein
MAKIECGRQYSCVGSTAERSCEWCAASSDVEGEVDRGSAGHLSEAEKLRNGEIELRSDRERVGILEFREGSGVGGGKERETASTRKGMAATK